MMVSKTNLIRIASETPLQHPVHDLFVAMARQASLLQDKFARASFLEGLMGLHPNTIVRNPEPWFREAREALQKGEPNQIIDALKARDAELRDLILMVGNQDTKIFDSLIYGIARVTPKGGIRGHQPEDIAQALSAGVSVITGEPLRYGPGKSVFYHVGVKWNGRFSVKGLAFILGKEGKNRAYDVIRGTRREDTHSTSLDAPVGEESGSRVQDFLRGRGSVSRGDWAEFADAIYHDPAFIEELDKIVKSRLDGGMQLATWEAIKADPSVLVVTTEGIGLQSKKLAVRVAEAMGIDITKRDIRTSVYKIFMDKILPVLQGAFENENLLQKILKNRDILSIIEESTGHAVLAGSQTPWKVNGISFGSSKERVLVAHLKKAWSIGLPAREIPRYKRMVEWAHNKAPSFSVSGALDTDKLAAAMARELGKPWLADEPTHWIWEIVYDLERSGDF